MEWTTYWFEIVGEDSDLCGEEFFTALYTAFCRNKRSKKLKAQHVDYAQSIFPGENIKCLGYVTEEEAEMMGLDTY